jgi:hypothetical protein
LTQLKVDHLQNTLNVFRNVCVGHAYYAHTIGFEERCPLRILGEFAGVSMRRTVYFDSQPCVITEEVQDIRIECHLPPELPSIDLTIAQLHPKDVLGGSVGPTQ